MKPSETGKLLLLISEAFQGRFEVTEGLILLWHRIIGHHEFNLAQLAFANWYSRPQNHPPQPGHINEEILKLTQSKESGLDWADAWNQLIKCISVHGSMRASEAVRTLTERTQRALGYEAGFKELCFLSNADIPTFRAQFRQRYDSLSNLERTEKLSIPRLQPQLQALLENTTKDLTKQ